MRRTLHFAILLLTTAALAPSCLLDSGPYETGGKGGTGATGTAGTTAAGATAGNGGTGGTSGTGGTGGSPALCGDGDIEGAEQCDDGNPVAADGCSIDCKIEPGYSCDGEPSICSATCGNGVIDAGGEQCDDANVAVGDGCSQGCTIEDGWECQGAGSMSCHLSCGDATLDGNEGCDVGADMPGDGCGADCQPDLGWKCTQPGGDMQPSACATDCGDGIIAGAEACDDDNGAAGDGCTQCVVDSGWSCTGAPSMCNTVCGDAVGAGTEQCDDGNKSAGDGCDGACNLEATCGNSLIEPGEICDEGMGNADCPDCKTIGAGKGTCQNAISLGPGAQDGMNPIVTTFEGDTIIMTANGGDLLNPTCGDPQIPRLFAYHTGNHGSVVTARTKAGVVDSVATFADTVLWAYRDCIGKAGEVDCSNNIDQAGGNLYSEIETGYLPPSTTLYIVVDGPAGQKGKFILEIVEQPVKLLFGTTFDAGLDGLVTSDGGNAGSNWLFCPSGCGGNTTGSWSVGGFAAVTDAAENNMSKELMQTPSLDSTGIQSLFVQYDLHFSQKGGGVTEEFGVQHKIGGGAFTSLFATNGTLNVPVTNDASAALNGASSYAVQFSYDDGGGDGDYVKIDDLFIYGY